MLFLELFTSNDQSSTKNIVTREMPIFRVIEIFHMITSLGSYKSTMCAQLTGTPHIYLFLSLWPSRTTTNAIILVVNQLASFGNAACKYMAIGHRQ